MSKEARINRFIRKQKQMRLLAAKAPSAFLGQPLHEVKFEAAGEGGGEADGLKRFRMKLYSAGRMRPMGFPYDVVCDMGGVKIAAGDRPAFLEHDRLKIVGHQQITADASGIHSVGVVSGAGDAAREVTESSAKGFPWKASVGGSIEEMHFIEKGESAQANGKTWKGPIFIIRATTIYEGSFVSIAGDNTSSAKIAALAAQFGADEMNFEQWLAANGFDINAITDKQRTSLKAMWQADQDEEGAPSTIVAGGGGAPIVTPPTPPTPPTQLVASGADLANLRSQILADLQASALGELRTVTAGEHERISRIRAMAGEYNVDKIEASAGVQVDFVAHAIKEGWNVEKAELVALRASRPTVGPAVHIVNNEQSAPVLEAALCLTGGMSEAFVASTYSDSTREQVMNRATGRDMRGAGIQTLMYDTIRAAGMSVRPGTVNDDIIRTFLRASTQLDLRASGPSTTSASGILGNVANKSLLQQYQAVADVVGLIANKTTANDFKPMTRYRLTGDAQFLEVGANGEIKSFELGEDSYTNAIKTYGRSIMLNRQMMRNDDLGAFLALPAILGRGAALCRNKGFFTLLLANAGPFFSVGNKNYFSGAATNLQVSSLTTAQQMFLEMKDSKGNFIEAMPALLLVPPSLKVLADQLYTDTVVNETTTANLPKPNSNPHSGKFKPISSPYLGGQSGIANASDTAFYVIAAPNDVPIAEVAYLDGNETPVLQSSEADFDVLGMRWRSFWDLGFALANKTGGVMSKGAA